AGPRTCEETSRSPHAQATCLPFPSTSSPHGRMAVAGATSPSSSVKVRKLLMLSIGRLVTLVEIHRRGEVAAPLFPLLVAQNVARLSVWHPDRVVPRRVPRGALAAAAGAVALLGIVVALGPRLVPPPPVVGAERPPGGIEPVDLTADRLALAPANGDDDATETSNEESAAARLQEGIRRALAPAPT